MDARSRATAEGSAHLIAKHIYLQDALRAEDMLQLFLEASEGHFKAALGMQDTRQPALHCGMFGLEEAPCWEPPVW
jgi:hypothetical protein